MAVTMNLSVYWDVTPLSLVPHHIHEAIKLSHNLNTHTSFEILNLTNSVSQRLQFETQQCYVRLYNVRHLVMSMLIKIQPDEQYSHVYLLQSHSTCFGCHSTHHQEY